MKKIDAGFLHLGLACALFVVVFATLSRAETSPVQRVIALGGSVTEIVVALDRAAVLVARDSTSTYPASVLALPDVGYVRALSPEGVLSVAPDLIIAEGGAGPVETIQVLQSAAVPFVSVPDGYDGAAILAKIAVVAQALGVPDAGAALQASVAADLDRATALAATRTGRKRVLFILSMQGGGILAAGSDTSAAGIIALAGADNAMTGFQGYKPVSTEAIIAAAPDVILMMDRSGDHAATDAEVLAHPAIVTTPAAKAKSVIRMDGLYLLGFGPRTAQAALDLAGKIYPGTSN